MNTDAQRLAGATKKVLRYPERGIPFDYGGEASQERGRKAVAWEVERLYREGPPITAATR